MPDFTQAISLIREFKGSSYVFGRGALARVGEVASSAGKSAVLIYTEFPGVQGYAEDIQRQLSAAGVRLLKVVPGARPNCPREDLSRIAGEIRQASPALIVSFGGGSTIDAAKAAEVLRTLGGGIEDYFGTGLVTEALKRSGRRLSPHLAVQTAASSAAHLTKYSNITDLSTGQKKLIVDEAIVPSHPLFDYSVTDTAPKALTADGALDGIAHVLEVLYGAVKLPIYPRMKAVAEEGIRLVVGYLPRAMNDPADAEARDALCLATDLGGYAIMLGGTNGGHLTSFSLVDILSHGRACAMMNPYYTVFFAPSIEEPLRLVGRIYLEAGYITRGIEGLKGRELGLAVAEGMFAFARRIGFPTRLSEVAGFRPDHIERALAAAKNPQLKMKLENMPVPLTAAMVDEYMGPILRAARDGDPAAIRNV
jgi:alcohol dehydrogenase class IV